MIPVIATAAAIQGRDLMTCLKNVRGMDEGRPGQPPPGWRSVLVRPKIATNSESSLDTLRSFQPRLRISARQVMSFSQSFALVLKTLTSATRSHDSGYGRFLSCIGLGLVTIPVQRPQRCPQSYAAFRNSGRGEKADGRRGMDSAPLARLPRQAVSRVLFPGPKPGGWSSVWDGCHQPPRAAYPRLAGSRDPVGGVGHTSPLIWPCSDWGLPCHR